MTDHIPRSRITKALTDADIAPTFAAAEARLDAVRPCVAVSRVDAATAAGQTAALTSLVTAQKCFGRVRISSDGLDMPLLQPLYAGRTLGEAAAGLGADVGMHIGSDISHLIRIGDATPWQGWQVSTWWNRWLAGTRRLQEPVGASSCPLSGMFAGALAVRQMFAHIVSARAPRDVSLSLWEPGVSARPELVGPTQCTVPTHLWLVGLGHLGQAYVWGLLALPLRGPRHVVLQDDQNIGVENEPTSMLVGKKDIGTRKVRVASKWLEQAGWTTELIERRHFGDIALRPDDPQILLGGLDDVKPRRILAQHGFEYMIDAGIGRDARDFESLQVRTIPAGANVDGLWLEQAATQRDKLMDKEAYGDLEREIGLCGVVPFADASVAVPFVGAATAALVIAQLAKIGSMQPSAALLQLELAAPEMIIDGGHVDAGRSHMGGEIMDFS